MSPGRCPEASREQGVTPARRRRPSPNLQHTSGRPPRLGDGRGQDRGGGEGGDKFDGNRDALFLLPDGRLRRGALTAPTAKVLTSLWLLADRLIVTEEADLIAVPDRYRTGLRGWYRKAGSIGVLASRTDALKREEKLMTASLILQRKLFGLVYRLLQPDYFDVMPRDSGVYVSIAVRTNRILPEVSNPGDIDLLVIPYEGDELLLSRVIAAEIKIIRASFQRQGKSPNEMGFSQAGQLLDAGFPYVAVLHLIVSDQSPEHAWEPMGRTTILNEDGLCGPLTTELVDTLPKRLLDRGIGRLLSARTRSEIGLAAAFLGATDDEVTHVNRGAGMWFPEGSAAAPNPNRKPEIGLEIAAYFERNSRWFADIPRFDPERR